MKKDFEKYAKKHLNVSSSLVDSYLKASMTPNIVEEKRINASIMDVFSRLMLERIIFLGMPIDSDVACMINAQLLYLESIDPKQDISIYLSTPGGIVYDGLAIYDTMQIVSPKIKTVNMGLAASMGSVILCGGEKGMRYSLKHARTMLHQPHGGADGQASDIEIVSKEIQKLKKELYKIWVDHSNMDMKSLMTYAERDYWLTSAETKKLGLIDHVLTKVTK